MELQSVHMVNLLSLYHKQVQSQYAITQHLAIIRFLSQCTKNLKCCDIFLAEFQILCFDIMPQQLCLRYGNDLTAVSETSPRKLR